MAVHGFEVVCMSQNHIVAVASAFVLGYTHTSVESSAYGITNLHFQVNTFVHATEAFAIAVWRGYITRMRHTEVLYINYCSLRYIHAAITVYHIATPAFGVDIAFGFFFLFE